MPNSAPSEHGDDPANGGTVEEARQMAAHLVDKWDHLNDEEKFGTVSQIVHQLATAESKSEKTDQEEWEEHNESFDYEPPELPADRWSSEQTQELVDRVISRRTNWFCDKCTGRGPISNVRKARRHVENQHLPGLLEKYETPREDLETATDGGDGSEHDIEARRENNSQLEEFEDD